MGFLLQAKINTSTGKTIDVFTDNTWKSRMADWITVDYRLISLPVGQQLHSDPALEPLNWRTAASGEKWKNANLLGPLIYRLGLNSKNGRYLSRWKINILLILSGRGREAKKYFLLRIPCACV